MDNFECLQVCNHRTILASITYKHRCITVYKAFFLKTLNCFAVRNIIFARTVLHWISFYESLETLYNRTAKSGALMPLKSLASLRVLKKYVSKT